MSGPFHAPEGSSPATYKVTITAIVPNAHTDPACWDLDALLEFIRDTASWGAEVESVAAQWPDSAPEVPAEAPELVVSVTKARRSRERATGRDTGETEWEYGRDYARCAAMLQLGNIDRDEVGKAWRVWLTKPEREEVYELWCSRKGTTNRDQGNE